eukprot:3783316-Ditylum_brightwellii.AAC.1
MKGQREYAYVFLRDKEGKTQHNSDGSYSDIKPQRFIHKYKSESRFLFGVATVKLPNGEVVGKCLVPFYYTGEKIVNHKDWEIEIRREIAHEKNEGSEKKWSQKITCDA